MTPGGVTKIVVALELNLEADGCISTGVDELSYIRVVHMWNLESPVSGE
jgi:hypothetical protein